MSSSFYIFLFILLLSIQSTLTFHCYECNNCTDIPTCTCAHTMEINDTDSYCMILREIELGELHIEVKAFPKNLTRYQIYDPHYVSVTERIVYNDTTETWSGISEQITYACQTDYCNRAELLKELPANGLSLMLPTDWLNQNLQRQQIGNPTLCRSCDGESICSDSPETLNITLCHRSECQGSCLTDEVFDKTETTQLCYHSLCTDDTPIGPTGKLPEVTISAIYYIGLKRFDILQIDVICNADDCTHISLFKDIKDNLKKNLDNIKPFLPTTNNVNSIYSTSIIFLMIIFFLQIIIFY